MLKMNKSDSEAINVRRKVNVSTTLNRKYVKRPSSKASSAKASIEYRNEQLKRRKELAEKINRANSERLAAKQRGFVASSQKSTPKEVKEETPLTPAEKHPLQISANDKVRMRKTAPAEAPRKTASELKEAAIKKALTDIAKNQPEEPKALKTKPKFGFWRIVLALGCATASIFAIIYLVNINMPDFSLRVAAMQTGIEAKYPGYTPSGYSLEGITSESGKVTISFKNSSENKKFSIGEEKSSWDSTALLNNYVKPEMGNDYTIVREQGLTIYVTKANAAWVNGGVVYKLAFDDDSLTKNQIRSLATSL